jgi:hypothetical protein
LPFAANNTDLFESEPFGGYPRFYQYDDPHLKAFLLIQAHLSRHEKFPSSDYKTDMISVLESCVRLLQAMLDVVMADGYGSTALGIMNVLQCIKQAIWPGENPFLSVPNLRRETLRLIESMNLTRLSDYWIHKSTLDACSELKRFMTLLPRVKVKLSMNGATVECLKPISVARNELVKLSVTLHREGKGNIVSCHRFPKTMVESWWILVTEVCSGKARQLKRIPIQEKSIYQTTFTWTAPSEIGNYQYTLDCVCDGYVGLDFQETLHLVIT